MQGADDDQNCGVYVSWVLRAWVQGFQACAESLVHPLEFRRDILRLMQDAPTTPALPAESECEVCSESSAPGTNNPSVSLI